MCESYITPANLWESDSVAESRAIPPAAAPAPRAPAPAAGAASDSSLAQYGEKIMTTLGAMLTFSMLGISIN